MKYLLLLSLVACAPNENKYESYVDAECVIYTKSKWKCKHGKCYPLPTATPIPTSVPEPEPTTQPEETCAEVES